MATIDFDLIYRDAFDFLPQAYNVAFSNTLPYLSKEHPSQTNLASRKEERFRLTFFCLGRRKLLQHADAALRERAIRL